MVKNADENTEGYNRNQELQDKNFIEYKQLKRIKNFFDNFIGNHKEPSFILNGGVEMKNWVNNELRKMRDYTKMTKTNKMNAGMQNQFIKPHEKKDFTNVRPSQQHSNTSLPSYRGLFKLLLCITTTKNQMVYLVNGGVMFG